MQNQPGQLNEQESGQNQQQSDQHIVVNQDSIGIPIQQQIYDAQGLNMTKDERRIRSRKRLVIICTFFSIVVAVIFAVAAGGKKKTPKKIDNLPQGMAKKIYTMQNIAVEYFNEYYNGLVLFAIIFMFSSLIITFLNQTLYKKFRWFYILGNALRIVTALLCLLPKPDKRFVEQKDAQGIQIAQVITQTLTALMVCFFECLQRK